MTRVSTNLGKVATTPKGEYNSATTYKKLDVVLYQGSSYVCLQESTNNLPTNTTYWQLMASKGDTGATGQDGYTPVKGVDYFTEQDIASLNIPHDTNDLTNNAGFITKAVADLTNYYLKNETYTKEEVNTLIGNIYQFHYEIVQTLPQTGQNNILYLVPKQESETNDYYDEYVYSNGWERIGSTEIDLSGYQTLIDSTHKLDADLVDDSTSTNKFTNAVEKLYWNSKTTITYVNDSSNPFIFDGKKRGIYVFGYDTGLRYKISSDTATKVLSGITVVIFLFEDFNVPSTNIPGVIYYKPHDNSSSYRVTNDCMLYYPQIKNGDEINKMYVRNLGTYLTSGYQDFSGLKIFTTIPELSNNLTPSTDKQLVNKKYVDDQISSAIGSINTILATLTTPSNNGGGE